MIPVQRGLSLDIAITMAIANKLYLPPEKTTDGQQSASWVAETAALSSTSANIDARVLGRTGTATANLPSVGTSRPSTGGAGHRKIWQALLFLDGYV